LKLKSFCLNKNCKALQYQRIEIHLQIAINRVVVKGAEEALAVAHPGQKGKTKTAPVTKQPRSKGTPPFSRAPAHQSSNRLAAVANPSISKPTQPRARLMATHRRTLRRSLFARTPASLNSKTQANYPTARAHAPTQALKKTMASCLLIKVARKEPTIR